MTKISLLMQAEFSGVNTVDKLASFCKRNNLSIKDNWASKSLSVKCSDGTVAFFYTKKDEIRRAR